MDRLNFGERRADSEPSGLLVLHHGRGSDESDLIGLADALDPRRRLHVISPRAPLVLPGSPGFHWYKVPRVGFPDPETFQAARAELANFHDELWERTGLGPSETILGGFSMGAVMSYAMGLSRERPAPAGILACSGFIPTVEGWSPDAASRSETHVFVAHGRHDEVIQVGFARDARDRLREAGLAVEYHESSAGHLIDPSQIRPAAEWLVQVTRRARSDR